MIWKLQNIAPGFLNFRIKRCRFRKCSKFVIRSNAKKPGKSGYDSEYYFCSVLHKDYENRISKIHPDDDPKLLRAAELELREKIYGTDPLKNLNRIHDLMRTAPYSKTSKKYAPSRHYARIVTSAEINNKRDRIKNSSED